MTQFRYVQLCTPLPGGGCDSHPSCQSPGKRPLALDWASHWSLERPAGNAGVICGPESGLLVVDVDTVEALDQYVEWGLPQTFTVKSGRMGQHGMHYYYRWPEGLDRVPNRLDGVEIKGPGRQVVAWDSLHASGNRYQKLGGQLADLPEWFVDRLRESAVQHTLSEVVDATPGAERALERLLAVASEVSEVTEQRDGNYLTCCPAHDDHDPSLVIKASGDRVLVNCRAGCSADDVMDSYGLTMSDLFAAPELGRKEVLVLEKRQLGTADNLGTRARLSELMRASLGDVSWVVPDLLPDGLALLAGPPKLGKSWMVLDIAISVALGRPVLGRDVEQGDVLYLALEDNWRRLQGRARTVLAGAPAPDRLELWTRAGTLTSGLIPEIGAWISEQKQPRLIIIDTLGRVQDGSAWVDAKDGGYADAVAALAGLQDIAAQQHVAVVVITHTKKGGWATGADPLEAVLGSQGYAGTADAVLVLKRERGSAGGELFVTGREIHEELVESVWFDREACRWMVGDPQYDTLEDQILDLLDEEQFKLSYQEIGTKVHRREADVKAALERLQAQGTVTTVPRPGRGRSGVLWGPTTGLPQAS